MQLIRILDQGDMAGNVFMDINNCSKWITPTRNWDGVPWKKVWLRLIYEIPEMGNNKE